jgi:hypothetical protein
MKKFRKLIDSLSHKERLTKILTLSGSSDINYEDSLLLNELILFESNEFLGKYGEAFIVAAGRKDRRTHKENRCYENSAKMMKKGYDYVEGYVYDRKLKMKFAHAWNINSNGDHVDFTFDEVGDYDYFGVEFPENIVDCVAILNDSYFSIIPFLPES